MTSAKIIADSITEDGHRLTTMEVTFHRFVLAEFNTHRVFSRNSASSRAIPYDKQLDRVRYDPAMPVSWPREQRGMQGGEELLGEDRDHAIWWWRYTRREVMRNTKELRRVKLHKSVVNRLLEPYLWHTVIVTSTAWRNFFAQRASPLAQPEIRVAAEQMQAAYIDSVPKKVEEGDWHLPYIRSEDWDEITSRGVPADEALKGLIEISVARCARVSYLTHDGQRDIDKDLNLYERLVSARPMHASPLEHVATPAAWNQQVVNVPGVGITEPVPKVGNLLGWKQHRLDVELERDIDSYS